MIRNQKPLGIDTSHKIPPPLVTRKYHQIAVEPLFHEIYAKNEIMARNQKPFDN